MSEDKRPRNEFVKCVCGITYISGYTHCPKCGLKNPNDELPAKALVKSPETDQMVLKHDAPN